MLVPSNSGWVRKVKVGPMPRACSATSERDLPGFRTPCSPSKKRNKMRDRFPSETAHCSTSRISEAKWVRSKQNWLWSSQNSNPGQVAAGGSPGPESSILKLKGTEIQQRISELNLEAGGLFGSLGIHTRQGLALHAAPRNITSAGERPPFTGCKRGSKTSSPKTCWGWVSAWIYTDRNATPLRRLGLCYLRRQASVTPS